MKNKDFFQAAYESNRDQWLCADSWYEAERIRPSAQYIIQITCADKAVNGVDIGDSYLNRTADNFNQDSNITITSTIVGTTYREFLAQSEEQPFTVGRTMIISTSDGQLERPCVITHRNASGDRQDFSVAQTLDPYQKLTDRIIEDYEYIFDGMTRLRFTRINSFATVTVRFYLVNKWAASQQLAEREPLQDYAQPKITPQLINQ